MRVAVLVTFVHKMERVTVGPANKNEAKNYIERETKGRR